MTTKRKINNKKTIMKKTIILTIIILFSINLHSQNVKATLEMKNNITQTGYVSLVSMFDKTVLFKKNEDSKKEKINSEDVLKIIYEIDGTKITAEKKNIIDLKKNGEKKIITKLHWLYKVYDKGLVVYTTSLSWGDVNKHVGYINETDQFFYLSKKDSDEIFYIYYKSGMQSISLTSLEGYINKVSKYLFNESCNSFCQNIEKNDFKRKNAIFEIVKIYEESCK